MKKVFILALTVFTLYSCGNNNKTTEEQATDIVEVVMIDDGHNARNSLDYEGTYRGVLPAADAEGIETTIILTDSTYTKSISYIGKMGIMPVEEGKYTWNKEGNTITLEGVDSPNKYFVAENQLFALDMDGKRITGNLADNYILKKQ